MTERIGISGLGFIGRRHASVARQAGFDVLVFDPATDEGPDTVTSFDDLLSAGLTALVVSGPDAVHADQVRAACAAGIPTLVEKPVADTLEAARATAEVAAASQVPVLPGYVLRHTLVLARAREIIAEGLLGEIVSFQVNLGAYTTLLLADNRFARPVENQLLLDYSHEWDYLQWLLGPARRCLAVSRAVRMPVEVHPNVVDGMLELSEGVVGTFHIDYVQQPTRRELTLIGSRGTADVDIRYGMLEVTLAEEGFSRRYRCTEADEDPLRRQLDHLLAVARQEEPPIISVQDGVRAIAVTHALGESAAAGSWITVPGE